MKPWVIAPVLCMSVGAIFLFWNLQEDIKVTNTEVFVEQGSLALKNFDESNPQNQIYKPSFSAVELGEPCSNPIPTDIIDVVIRETEVLKHGYEFESGVRKFTEKFETVNSGDGVGQNICGLSIVITKEGESYDVNEGSVLLKYGWDTKGSIVLNSQTVDLYLASGGKALSTFDTYIHSPTEAEPYLQFLMVQEKRKVSGWSEQDGHYCPCTYVREYFVSEQYSVEQLKKAYGVE